jgi:hypothetical protein
VTNEDQIAALFANANPVPSLDVLDPVEPLDMDRLEKRVERSRGMTDTKTHRVKVDGPGRWRRIAPVLAIPVIVLVALLILVNRNSEVATTVPAVPLPSTGSLDPGTYYISDGRMTPGLFTFTVPEGWATDEGFVTKNLEDEPIGTYGVGNNLLLVTWIVSHVYADICDWEGTMIDVEGTVGFSLPTVVQLTDALVGQEGRVASAPTDVMLGGFPATRIELTVPADLDVAACNGGIIRFWPDTGGSESGGLCCAPVGSTDVVYVVDVDGNTFVVVARHTAASSAEDRAELDAILESIRIDPPETSSTTSP